MTDIFTYKAFTSDLTPIAFKKCLTGDATKTLSFTPRYERACMLLDRINDWPRNDMKSYMTFLIMQLWKLDMFGFEMIPGKFNIYIDGDSLLEYVRKLDFEHLSLPKSADSRSRIAGIKDTLTAIAVTVSALYCYRMNKLVEIDSILGALTYPCSKDEQCKKNLREAQNMLENNITFSRSLYNSSVLDFLTPMQENGSNTKIPMAY